MEATTADSTSTEALRKTSGWTIVFGIALIILGFLAIGCPLVTGVWVALFVGAFMVVGGIFHLIHAFKAESWGGGILAVLGGILWIVCGALVLAHPLLGLSFLTLLLAAFFLVDGIARIGLSFRIRPRKGWGWTLFGGIAALLLGILIWAQWPLSGVWAVGLLVGIDILFSGWSMLIVGQAVRSEALESPA